MGTPKSDYGYAIEAVVKNFVNYFSSKDNMLEPDPGKPYYPFQIYPSFETDRALGQNGYQRVPYDINTTKSLPDNYDEKDVKDQLPLNPDADGDGECNIINPFTNMCTFNGTGDNHRGYLGSRNHADNSTILDDGAINIVVDRWDLT